MRIKALTNSGKNLAELPQKSGYVTKKQDQSELTVTVSDQTTMHKHCTVPQRPVNAQYAIPRLATM